ncbi:hypothetical protein QUF54_01745 [Candidatus Marithioploca araucensis]|uniref:MORN repeat-containing protein n=1 Tax=Candidatus Marithioploca araucensis TaxID=70273 RepID=A0ABT7VQW4_9GAMM|nr:hypothetical protein [Candidatus Marithioploca araucensis]
MHQIRLTFWFLCILFLAMPLYAAYDDDEIYDGGIPTIEKYVHWPNGDRYYGDYVEKERTGDGVYIWANGDRYKGEFFEGKRDGEGAYIWANGDRYKGDYAENQRDGEGFYLWSNGEQFKGDFSKGKREDSKITKSFKAKYIPPFPTIKIIAKGRPLRAFDKITTPDIAENGLGDNDGKTRIAQIDNNRVDDFDDADDGSDFSNDADEDITVENINGSDFSGDADDDITVADINESDFSEDTDEDMTATDDGSNFSEDTDDDDITVADINESDFSRDTSEDTTATDDRSDLEKIEKDVIVKIKEDIKIVEVKDSHLELEELKKQDITVVEIEDSELEISDEGITDDIGKEEKITVTENEPKDIKEKTIAAQTKPKEPQVINGKITIKWPNGDVYEGEYLNGKRTGQGMYSWTNGDRYAGEFMAGKRHGMGIFFWRNGDRYAGEYVNDLRHGKGLYKWANGDRYQGDFFKSKRHGRGTLSWADGEIYEGDFVEGQRTGKGIYIASGNDRYIGHFENGKRLGKGTFISANDGTLKEIEFDKKRYTLQELEFKYGKLVSANVIAKEAGEMEEPTDNEEMD